MIAKSDLAKLYETLLTIPGMNNRVKIDLKMPLRTALLLSKIIERGLLGKEIDDPSNQILDMLSPEMTNELMEIPKEILQRTGLIEMNEKIKAFNLK